MSKDETVKILAVLKAAYPNFYKNISSQDATGVINLWTLQFKSVPVDIVYLAVTKLIATNTFPPSISEVKKKLASMHYEALSNLITENLDQSNADEMKRIAYYCKQIDVETEPSLSSLISERRKTLEAHDKQQGYMSSLQARGQSGDLL